MCARPNWGSSPIVNVHVHFDRRVTDHAFLAGLGTEAQWVFDRTASSGATSGQYLAVSLSAADDLIGRPEDLTSRVVASLRALLPAARSANVLGSLVTREHHATFRATPGAAVNRAPAGHGGEGSCWPAHGRPRVGHQPWKGPCAAGSAPPEPCSSQPGSETGCRHFLEMWPGERLAPRAGLRSIVAPPRGANRPRWRGPPNNKANHRHGTGKWSPSGARST